MSVKVINIKTKYVLKGSMIQNYTVITGLYSYKSKLLHLKLKHYFCIL